MSSLRFALSCTVFGLLAFTPIITYADPLDDHLSPRAEISVKGGSDRSVLTTEFWAPLAQQSGRIVYTDLRLMGDDDDNREGNLGLGYRQVTDWSDSVLGGHIWIDRRRTEHNNTFHQVTIGVESLGKVIDLRANGYIPLNSGGDTVTTPNMGSATPYLAGSGLFYDTNGSITETPQYGVDAELGYRVPVLQKYTDTIRIYGGGYSFFRSDTDSTTGYRARIEAVVNPVLSLGARFQHDAPRGDQGFLEATLRFPFSAKKLFQQKGLYGRLDESPERDVDIVTSRKVDTGLRKQIVNTATGEAQRILYVDNSQANGNGTIEHPFNNLQSAQAALKANDILYVKSGTGTTQNMDQGISISQSGVSLIGSGSALTVGGYTFLNAGTAPVITNTQTSTDDFTGNGIFINASDVLISGVNVTGAIKNGIIYRADSGQVFNHATLTNVTTANNGQYGSIFYSVNGGRIDNINANNITTLNNTNFGLIVQASFDGVINNAIVSNITANNNGTAGVDVSSSLNGFINQISFNNINASINNGEGIRAIAASGGVINTLNVSNNTTQNNISNGITATVTGTNSTISNIVINNNATSSNGIDGIRVTTPSGGLLNNLTIDNNTSVSNFGVVSNGIDVQSDGGTIGIANITNNNVSNNRASGFFLSSRANGRWDTLNLLNNVGNANAGGAGAYITTGPGGTFNQVNVQNLVADNNSGSANGLTIFAAGIGSQINQITVNNITAINNGASGVSVSSNTGGVINTATVSAITSTNNGGNGLTIGVASQGSIGSISADNIVAVNNAVNGIGVTVTNTSTVIGQITLSNVIGLTNGQNGIGVVAQTSGAINSVNMSNITANGNLTGQGINLTSQTAANINSIVVNQSTLNSNKVRGMIVYANSGTIGDVNIANTTANNNATIGIHVRSGGAGAVINNVTISGNTANTNGDKGLDVDALTGGQIGNININSNTANSNVTQGLYAAAGNTGSTFGTVVIAGNTFNNNGEGIYSYNSGGAQIGSITVSGNTATGNIGVNGRGIQLRADGAGTLITTAIITGNNNFSGNAVQGIFAGASNSGVITNYTISNNIASGNTNYGIFANAATGGQITNLTINGNVSNANAQRGLFVYSQGTASSIGNAVISNNTSNSNTGSVGYGIQIQADNTATLSATLLHNTATGNAQNGLWIFKNNGVSSFVVDAGNATAGTGQNRIFSNAGTEVRVENGYAFSAQRNYWGGGDLVAGEKTLTGGATVDSTGFLTVDPGP